MNCSLIELSQHGWHVMIEACLIFLNFEGLRLIWKFENPLNSRNGKSKELTFENQSPTYIISKTLLFFIVKWKTLLNENRKQLIYFKIYVGTEKLQNQNIKVCWFLKTIFKHKPIFMLWLFFSANML